MAVRKVWADEEIKATHASNTLNKWLRSVPGVPPHKSTHCFRHPMRDHMRAAQVPSDIQNAIGALGKAGALGRVTARILTLSLVL